MITMKYFKNALGDMIEEKRLHDLQIELDYHELKIKQIKMKMEQVRDDMDD